MLLAMIDLLISPLKMYKVDQLSESQFVFLEIFEMTICQSNDQLGAICSWIKTRFC